MKGKKKSGCCALTRFDRASVIGFTGYQERMARMQKELMRVGLKAGTKWTFPNPFDDVVSRHVPMGFEGRAYLSMTMAHYAAIKTAHELGARSLLLMEDDCRFLLDVERLAAAIECLPDDYDVALLDSFNYCRFNEDEHRRLLAGRVNEWWCRCGVKRCSTACYALSVRGMERLVECYENSARGKAKLLVCDQYFEERWMRGLNWYCAFPNVAIQCRTPGSTTGYETIAGIYAAEGLKEEDYAAY